MYRLVVQPGIIEFDYVNWKGEHRHRKAEIRSIRFGTSEYYPHPTWLALGVDMDRNVEREYSMLNMTNVQHLLG